MGVDISYVLMGIFAWMFSSTVHEASHALVSLKVGDPTAYHGGQVTLNPIPHIKREPLGMLVVPFVTLLFGLGFIGWASAPVDGHFAARYPHRSAKIAAAGPLSNLAIAILVIIALNLIYRGTALGVDPNSVAAIVLQFLKFMVYMNILLFIFNLIPLYPLDGSEIILYFFPESRAEEIRTRLRSVGILGIFIAIIVLNQIYPPIVNFAARFLP